MVLLVLWYEVPSLLPLSHTSNFLSLSDLWLLLLDTDVDSLCVSLSTRIQSLSQANSHRSCGRDTQRGRKKASVRILPLHCSTSLQLSPFIVLLLLKQAESSRRGLWIEGKCVPSFSFFFTFSVASCFTFHVWKSIPFLSTTSFKWILSALKIDRVHILLLGFVWLCENFFFSLLSYNKTFICLPYW